MLTIVKGLLSSSQIKITYCPSWPGGTLCRVKATDYLTTTGTPFSLEADAEKICGKLLCWKEGDAVA